MTFFRNFTALTCLTLLIAATLSPAFAQQSIPLKIAVVNIEKVLGTASAPKGIRKQVQNIQSSFRQEIQAEEENLRQANQELAQKQSLLSPEAFKEERRQFEQKVLNVQKNVQQKNVTLKKAQQEAQQQVKNALREVVLAVAKEQGFTLVLRRAQTVVVADQLDITDLVVAALNKKLPNVTVNTK